MRVHKKTADVGQVISVQNLVIRPVQRRTQDIDKWRRALQNAEAINPSRIELYDLYFDLLLDGTLSSVIDKRIKGVTKSKLTFLDSSGKEVKDLTDLIKTKQFRKLRKQMALQKMWGITVCELTIKNGKFNVFSVPRKHIRPDLGRIVYEQYGTAGDNYREAPFDRYILEVGEPDDLGLLLNAAQYVIYKRGGFGDWAQFAQLFGVPFREARYDGYNEQVRLQLEKAMDEAGSAAYAILPKDAEFKIHAAPNMSGSTDLFDKLRRACNEEICILILGQTETTTSSKSSGYAQSQTHADVLESILEDDREEELTTLNEQVLPILANLGYAVEGGGFAYKMQPEKLGKKDQADIVVKFKKEIGLPVDDDYIYDEFGIPKPKNYDQIKSEQPKPTQPPADPDEEEDDEDVEPPPPKKAKQNKENPKRKLSTWNRLRLKLADFFDHAPNS